MKIAIMTDSFSKLIGAKDFIINIMSAISETAKNKNDEIFVFIKKDKFYRNFKGLKRLKSKIQYIFSKNAYELSTFSKEFPTIKNVKFVYHNCKLEQILDDFNLDIIFPRTSSSTKNLKIPSIGYLYDCQHKYYPEFFTQQVIEKRNSYFGKMVANPCLVNSKDAKNDLVKFFNANPDITYALPFSPKLNLTYLEDNSTLIKKYNLPNRYFLSSNQFWVHKDHPTLFKAFALLSCEEEFKDVELFCTGTMQDERKPDYIDELEILIRELGIEKKVHLLGLIPKIEQIEIMKKTTAVIQTTLFEGGPGGGCIWDSCALGIRSIVSDIPINHEIEDELVTFFEKKNEIDLKNKMIEILNSKPKQYTKDELIKKTSKNIELLGNYLYEMINDVLKKAKNG